MMQNLGSKPNTSCNAITVFVIIIGFLYLSRNWFIIFTSSQTSDSVGKKVGYIWAKGGLKVG